MSSAGKKTDTSEARGDEKEGRRKPKTSSSDHLSSIDKLLGAAFDLMKQTTAVDRAAFEQLRQLRVKIRYALSDIEGRESRDIPRKAPILFREHSDEDPLVFTSRVYSKWLWKNISRSDIRRLDPQLYNALYNLNEPSEKMDQIGLRTKKQLNDMKLETISKIQRPSTTLKMGELPPDQREHLRLHNLIRNRRQRSKI